MNFKNGIKFLANPKKYITKLVLRNTERTISKIADNDFLTPINQTEPQDVFIAGFPKSGNTWMQSLVAGLLYGIDTEYMPDKLAQEIVPDVHTRNYYKRFGTINFFKTHHLPQPHYKKVIYLVRDGRDAIVSYYHFNKKHGSNCSLQKMLLNGTEIFPSKWHIHASEWLKNPYNAEIITIRYEDLINQPLIELKKICSFIKINRSNELLTKVIEGNKIDKMRDRVIKTGGMGHHAWQGDKASNFFRKGKIGGYKDEIPKELITYFNNEAYEQLIHFNYQIE